MKELLLGKKILITGGSSGIGRATAIFCVQQGATVVITGRSEKRLFETREMCAVTQRCIPIVCKDLSSNENVKNLFSKAVSTIEALDGVVHCAGVTKLVPLNIVSEKSYDEHFNIHVKASFFIAKEFQKKKNRNQNGASLVFISSVSAYRAATAQSLYAAAKSAQIGLTKTLAIELVAKKIRVNAIAPADVNTTMSENCLAMLSRQQHQQHVSKHPMGLGNADDVAYGAAFLLSDYTRWVTGVTHFVDGGFSAT